MWELPAAKTLRVLGDFTTAEGREGEEKSGNQMRKEEVVSASGFLI